MDYNKNEILDIIIKGLLADDELLNEADTVTVLNATDIYNELTDRLDEEELRSEIEDLKHELEGVRSEADNYEEDIAYLEEKVNTMITECTELEIQLEHAKSDLAICESDNDYLKTDLEEIRDRLD